MSPYASSNLDDVLTKALNEPARVELWESLFEPSGPRTPESRKAYFTQLYSDEQLRLKGGLKEGSRKADQLACRIHRDLIDVVEVLRRNRDDNRSKSISELKLKYPHSSEYQINSSIDLAIRIAFLVNARSAEERGASPSTQSLLWETDQTLRTFFSEILPPSSWKPKGKESLTRLNARFTAGFMSEICGLKLEYTSSLQEHLRLDWSEGHPVLRVFPYKACLFVLSKAKDPIIPRQILNEALLTLNLLFPFSDPASEKVLKKYTPTIRFHVDEPYGGTRSLNVFEYDVWRDRLLELYEDVYNSPPASWGQLWRDNRDPTKYWTFWIALVILILTIVSTIASICQTVFSALAYYRQSASSPVNS